MRQRLHTPPRSKSPPTSTGARGSAKPGDACQEEAGQARRRLCFVRKRILAAAFPPFVPSMLLLDDSATRQPGWHLSKGRHRMPMGRHVGASWPQRTRAGPVQIQKRRKFVTHKKDFEDLRGGVYMVWAVLGTGGFVLDFQPHRPQKPFTLFGSATQHNLRLEPCRLEETIRTHVLG